MKNNLFLFFALISVFIIFMFLGNVKIDFGNLFLGNIFSNSIWIFIIFWISIFIYGKKIIDNFEKENNTLIIKKILLFIFISSLFLFFLDNFFLDFINWFYKNILIILFVIFWWLYFYSERNFTIKDDIKINNKTFYVLFISILIIWFSNIFINLWKLPFHQDEQYHFSPAITYNNTWEFAKWDFLNNTIWDYSWADRNKSLTIMTSISQKIFWLSEFSSRLPIAIFGFLWMFLIFFVSKEITQNREIWLISMYFYAINDAILYFSRFLRWYIFLALIWLIIFYLIYRFLNEDENKKKLYFFILSIICFLIWFEFHATIILVWPLIIFGSFILINNFFSFKKHYLIYILFFSLLSIILLNILWIIHIFNTPYNIQNHIILNTNFSDWKTIYLDHISNSFNLWYVLIFILPIIFLYQFWKNYKIYTLFFLWIYVPLFFSIYFFNRYEDFRYILILQPLFIIFISYFIFYIWKTSTKNYLILFILIFLTSSIQFYWLKEIIPLSKKSIANWENIEWARLHFRLAQPENKKAFDYLFNNFDNMRILRIQDWWINWDDNYYLSNYAKRYPNINFSYYSNQNYYSDKFKEVYNTKNSTIDKNQVSFYDLYNKNYNLILVANVKHLFEKELLNFIENNCKNISPDIWIVKHKVLQADWENNYFPNIYICEKNKLDL